MAVLLVVSLFPTDLAKRASAATTTQATYFIPDNSFIRKTAGLSPTINSASPDYNTKGLTRANPDLYVIQSNKLTITGTYAYVLSTSMAAKIEQLNMNADGSWKADSTHFTTATVTEDLTQGTGKNLFIAKDLPLYSGMNKITLTGSTTGGVTRSDVFYVLYDQIPYIQNLKITSGNTLVNLNEGTQVVVPTTTVALQGYAANATRVTAGLEGGTQVVAPVYDDYNGDTNFFTPAFSLKPGKNVINLVVTNGANTINVKREVYYFDKKDPFVGVEIIKGAQKGDLKNSTPQITDSTGGAAANLKVQALVEYSATPFIGNATYSVNAATYGTITSVAGDTEVTIPGPDGVTPQYRLITFTLPTDFPLQTDGAGVKKDQSVKLDIKYGTFEATFNGNFKYLPGEKVITNMYYLPKYDGSSPITAADTVPLNNAEISTPSFYIMVESDQVITDPADKLSGKFLPISSQSLSLTYVSGTGNKLVYKVNGFPNGQQKIEFRLGTSSSTYIANIAFISKSYIYVSNLFDGQQYSFNSKNSNKIKVDGQYTGFNGNVTDAQLFINGNLYKDNSIFAAAVAANGVFSVELAVGDGTADEPLVFGENRIVFKGTNTVSAGNTQLITKEIKIYLIDENISTISKFMPTLATIGRQSVVPANTTTGYTETEISRIFAVVPEFTYLNGIYTTSKTTYDLALRGNGARTLNLRLGSDNLVTIQIPEIASTTDFNYESGYFSFPGLTDTLQYEFAGSEKDFVLRLKDIPFAAPGSHIYTLELVNGTGAITKQSLEIKREVSPYRLLAPQPTVGNQIVVNKNFVRFDIEAEGATSVIVGKEKATRRSDATDRFVYDYVGLKPNATNKINIQIVRANSTIKDTIEVYYSSSVQVDSQYMETIGTKHSLFNKQLQLTFPKGTVLKSVPLNNITVPKLYKDTKILFGIANTSDGVVERKNDYGNTINTDYDARTYQGRAQIIIPDRIALRFADNSQTSNFTRISNIYWISGGLGENGNKGDIDYKPATNGIPPYWDEGNEIDSARYFTEYQPGRKVVPSQRGSLTLSFDSSVVEEVGSMVTVFRYTDAGVWQNIGGEVNAKAHTITVPFDDFGYYQVVKLRRGYADVTNHGWARNILNALYSKGIMLNTRTDEFGANDLTTRGEFATLLVKGLNLPLKAEGNQTFFDISPGTSTRTWDYEHIETAARAGIVNGLSEGFFGPDIRITREDAAVMIAKALQLKLAVNDSKLEANLAKSFVDSGSIHTYARPAVEAVSKAKIMGGSPTTIPGSKKPQYSFNPKGNMTRAEAGKIAVALLQKNTKLFPKNLS